MVWFIYAFICALSVATADALSKKALAGNNDTYLIAWVRFAYAAPLMILIFPFIDIPELDSGFFIITFLLLPLDITALLLYMKAINISPLSLTLPFLSLTPVFLIGTSYVLLGEKPDRTGLMGIILVTIGAYLLNAHTISRGFLGPLKTICKERGSVLMILVAFIYSITSSLGKMAVQHSSPIFFSVFYPLLITIFLFLIVSFKTKDILPKTVSQPLLFFLIGILMVIMWVTHLMAISLVEVSYMISVKRLSLIFGIIYGAVLFKETNIKERLLGSAIMVLGVILISVF